MRIPRKIKKGLVKKLREHLGAGVKAKIVKTSIKVHIEGQNKKIDFEYERK